jgi:CheY-like chemotaxis protein
VNVLVVDSEEDCLQLVRHLLEEAGAIVRTASSASDALGAFKVSPPDLLLADLSLGGVDSYELLRQIRSGPAGNGHRVSAVAITARPWVYHRSQTVAAGFHDRILKPIDPAALLATVIAAAPQRT